MPFVTYVDPLSLVYSVVDFDVITEESHTLGTTVTEHPVEIGAPISDHVRPELLRLNIRGLISNTPIEAVTPGISPDTLYGQQLPVSVRVLSKKLIQPMQGTMGSGNTRITDVQGTPAIVPPWRILGLRPPVVPATAAPATYSSGFTASATAAEYDDIQDVAGGSLLQFVDPLDRVRKVFEKLEELSMTAVPIEVVTDVRTYSNMLITNIQCTRNGTTSLEFNMSLRELRIAQTLKTFVQRTKAKKKKPKETRADAPNNQGKQAEPWKFQVNKSVSIIALDAALGTNKWMPKPVPNAQRITGRPTTTTRTTGRPIIKFWAPNTPLPAPLPIDPGF